MTITSRYRLNPAVGTTLAAIAIGTFVTDYFAALMGDDLVYGGVFGGPYPEKESLLSLPRWAGSHWLTTNGRILNLLLPLLLVIPRWITALAGGALTGLLYLMPVKCAGIGKDRPLIAMLTIGAGVFALPWWDYMNIYACMTNYVWASALLLSAYYVIFHTNPRTAVQIAGAMLLCFVAGASHEAGGMPLCVGIAVLILIRREMPRGASRWLLLSLAAGAAFVTLCPGIILRAGAGQTADDSVAMLTLKTVPAVLVMLLTIGIMSTRKVGRRALGKESKSPVTALAVAAVVSAVVAILSGIVGRSGWFAETYAIVVLAYLANKAVKNELPAGRIAAWAIALLITVQAAYSVVYQYKIHKEFERYNRLYSESNNGIIFMDATRDSELPAILLNRLRGVPDHDDYYLHECLQRYYHKAEAPILLPEAIKSGATDRLTRGDTVYRQSRGPIYNDNGRTMVETGFILNGDTLYLGTVKEQDPGDK